MSAQLDAVRRQLEEMHQSERIVDYDEFHGLLGQFGESITVRDLVRFRAVAKRQINLIGLSPLESLAMTPEQREQVATFWHRVDDTLGQSLATTLPSEDAAKLDDLLTESDRAETLNMLVSRLAAAAQEHASMQLNGWQRLWVLTAAIWTVIVVLFTVSLGVGSPISTFAWWVIPPLSLYAFGWAIAWVRRGFSS